MISRNRTPSSEYIGYGVYFYFSGLSLRKTEKTDYQIALSKEIMHFWNWIQKVHTSKNIINKKKKISEYSCIQKDETAVLKLDASIFGYDWLLYY